MYSITSTISRALRIGFVPVNDCAPLAMACELGLFDRHGLAVELTRELGWATIRDKVVHGELDAAHALAAMPFAATLGLGSAGTPCVSGLVLSLQGNAITVSREVSRVLAGEGPGGLRSLAASRHDGRLTFGVVHPYSSHHFLMRRWLDRVGVEVGTHARVVVVPPPQMSANLATGNLDGFCAGEPWNSVAVRERAGCVAATSGELDAEHPEKVLMVRRAFRDDRSAEHAVMIAALIEACAFCNAPGNRRDVARTLSHRRYLNVDAEVIEAGLNGALPHAIPGADAAGAKPIFGGSHANEPCARKAAWVISNLHRFGLIPPTQTLAADFSRRVFDTESFDRASRLIGAQLNQHENQHTDTQLIPA